MESEFETEQSNNTRPVSTEFASSEPTPALGTMMVESAIDLSEAALDYEQPAPELQESTAPFVGRWNRLISSTNWEKGRIIFDWRNALIEQGAPATSYSDEAWAKCVGGVTSPHVGRLRRVFDRFGKDHESYPGLYWSHFLAALEWDDAPLWLEGAVRSGWSISQMRDQRWEAMGGKAEEKPQAKDIVASDEDEDVVLPAQGGGKEGRYEDSPDGVSAGPVNEGPDFGDEPNGGDFDGQKNDDDDDVEHLEGSSTPSLVQPFAGLPDLPPDMTEALELFKLAIIRHKAGGWNEISPEAVIKALDGLKLLVTARSE
jgi:hypothetical protein